MSSLPGKLICPCCRSILLSDNMWRVYNLLPATARQIKHKLGMGDEVGYILKMLINAGIVVRSKNKIIHHVPGYRLKMSYEYKKNDNINVFGYKR